MAAAVLDGLVSSDGVIWGCDCPQCSLSTDQQAYHKMSFESACNLPGYRHAAHAMIYAIDDRIFFNLNMIADIMMQMRFDGYLGFPGGFIDTTDESIVDGLNRELVEEINFDTNKHKVTQNNYIMSCVCSHKSLMTHFYAIEVTKAQFEDIEKRVLIAHDWGDETMGVIRVPLHTYEDGVRGFPVFLAGKFIGNSRKQLIATIIQKKIMSAEDVTRAVQSSSQLTP